jgi:hypothetical protein
MSAEVLEEFGFGLFEPSLSPLRNGGSVGKRFCKAVLRGNSGIPLHFGSSMRSIGANRLVWVRSGLRV